LWIVPAILLIAVSVLAAYAAITRSADSGYHAKLKKTIQVRSNSFKSEQEMPVEFSCKGKSMAPDITWTYPAEGTKSYALIAMDWDAPSPSLRLFPVTHWILYNIPPQTIQIPEGSTNTALADKKIAPGLNIAG